MPVDRSVGSPTANTRLLTIWATTTPIAAAASAAVRVPSGNVTISTARPWDCAASRTKRALRWRPPDEPEVNGEEGGSDMSRWCHVGPCQTAPMTDTGNAELRRWYVAGAVIEGAEGVLLVCNRRRNGSHDWSTPGGVIEDGEDTLEGLAREVAEETGILVTEWSEALYTVDTMATEMGWHLSVAVHAAKSWSGEISIDDPDGIVVDAEFVSVQRCVQLLSDGPAWVSEPLGEWLNERWSEPRTFTYHLTGSDRKSAVVARR